MPEKKRRALHQSTLERVSRCGIQEEFILQGLREPPGIASIRGSATHDGVHANLQTVIDAGKLLDPDMLEAITEDRFKKRWKREGFYLTDEEKSEGVRKVKEKTLRDALELTQVHHENKAPIILPVALEEPFRFHMKDFDFDIAGRMDCREFDTVRDVKTKQKKPAEIDAHSSFQYGFYGIAFKKLTGRFPKKFFQDNLILAKKGAWHWTQRTTRDTESYERLFRRIDKIATVIRTGAYAPANPTDWWCSPKWCGFWHRCPYRPGGKQFNKLVTSGK